MYWGIESIYNYNYKVEQYGIFVYDLTTIRSPHERAAPKLWLCDTRTTFGNPTVCRG